MDVFHWLLVVYIARAVLAVIGSGLAATGNPVLVAIGKRLEALGMDLPKLIKGEKTDLPAPVNTENK